MAAKKYTYAYGRRKTATATVRLYPEAGVSTINGKPAEEVYVGIAGQKRLVMPLTTAGLNPKDYHFTVQAKGGGVAAQLGAITLGLARCVVNIDAELKKPLKDAGLLTRDPRMVERKKPGMRKARKAEQYSKR
ncbi:30S ribosomal protein S9 [Candidatus Dojkabacteria bacterium]|uniref:Small ribosomal subunit protein uS9 n=1 Tax=Candidatus Dojkabacteria bacterium TaxID=2099670 RepID=A0A955I7J5_9BACT|nr:30S ribosomal protein S9 [Candidatus Dojkabacteria bacterium]